MIIDFRMTPPESEFMTPDEIEALSRSYLRGYWQTYASIEEMKSETVEDVIKSMDEGGVNKAVLQAEWGFGDYSKQNDAVYRMAQQHPDRFPAYYLCINLWEDDDMVKVIEREVKERGFSGVNTQTFSNRMYANDKRMYPIYARCQELGIPVTFHSSINFSVDRTIDFSRPIYIDEVACDFPNLIIVANHGGWPWVAEMVAIAWKHPNVYIEIGAVSPKYIGKAGTGWEPLMVYGNSLLQDQVLFATDKMLPPKRCVDELKELPLKEEVKEKWLGGNAARILNL